MNGYGGHQAPSASTWAAHHTPDGRAYYYNSATQVTQWTKPEEMMTPAEVRICYFAREHAWLCRC